MRPDTIKFAASIILLTVLTNSCEKPEKTEYIYLKQPVCGTIFTPKSYDYQVVGFYPSWKLSVLPMSEIPWNKLTRIIYAFAEPNTDGTLNTGSISNIDELVDLAHTQGVEVYFSVGGGGQSENFPLMATRESSRIRFVNEVRQFIFFHCLDGVDIDWEHWSGSATNSVVPAESNALVSIVSDLKAELSPFGIEMSIDLGASHWGGKHFFDQIPAYIDHLQVMCYDFSGPWSDPGPHSSFEDAIGSGSSASSLGLAYWVNYRGWPKEKILLGVPFYGRDFDTGGGAGVSYADILTEFPDAYLYDQKENIYYNGIATIAQKTQYVMDNNYSGIMIWEIAQDSQVDSLSLLSAIDRTLSALP
ncbi:MAG TPA: glycosyl hydrolase family 18 protein [Cyclobacteriaceae bacterium]|nr:glycosyl hydrolase family 18 protein [Cyclobacteriaceae bacterium]